MRTERTSQLRHAAFRARARLQHFERLHGEDGGGLHDHDVHSGNIDQVCAAMVGAARLRPGAGAAGWQRSRSMEFYGFPAVGSSDQRFYFCVQRAAAELLILSFWPKADIGSDAVDVRLWPKADVEEQLSKFPATCCAARFRERLIGTGEPQNRLSLRFPCGHQGPCRVESSRVASAPRALRCKNFWVTGICSIGVATRRSCSGASCSARAILYQR